VKKKHWERQIKYLGGPDYLNVGPRITDADGQRAVGTGGYFYFGAARELPGVKELFERIVPEPVKRTRGDMYKCIDANYYGYGDDDDGLLEKLENEQEKSLRQQEHKDYVVAQRLAKRQRLQALGLNQDEISDDEDVEYEEVLKAHVELPSQEEIERTILAKRKQALLDKYGQPSQTEIRTEEKISTPQMVC